MVFVCLFLFLLFVVFLFCFFFVFYEDSPWKCESEICPLVSVDQAENNVVSLIIQLVSCLQLARESGLCRCLFCP